MPIRSTTLTSSRTPGAYDHLLPAEFFANYKTKTDKVHPVARINQMTWAAKQRGF